LTLLPYCQWCGISGRVADRSEPRQLFPCHELFFRWWSLATTQSRLPLATVITLLEDLLLPAADQVEAYCHSPLSLISPLVSPNVFGLWTTFKLPQSPSRSTDGDDSALGRRLQVVPVVCMGKESSYLTASSPGRVSHLSLFIPFFCQMILSCALGEQERMNQKP